MPWYDALIHSFSTAGTGGFSNRNASVGAYGSVAIEMIISVFILLFSLNFAVYFLLLTKNGGRCWPATSCASSCWWWAPPQR